MTTPLQPQQDNAKQGVEPSPHQQQVLDRIKLFVLNPNEQVFVLKGYAGTGKTTLMQFLMHWMLKDVKVKDKFQPSLCATTGRAAKVLRDKTGYETSTVHSFIYRFTDLSHDLEKLAAEIRQPQVNPKTNQLTLLFDLRPPAEYHEDQKKQVIIIDEASMLSDENSGGDQPALFGTGKLLTDLMNYAKQCKIVFVGDVCQLPPIEQPNSPALDEDYIRHKFACNTASAELTEIHRQQKDHSILKLSMPLRHFVNHPQPGPFGSLPAKGLSNIHIHSDRDELIDEYIKILKEYGYNEAIFITRTNAFNYHISNYIRKQLGFLSNLPMVGDLLQITQNNYLVPLVNGDFVEVTAIGQMKVQANLPYLEVTVKTLHNDNYHQSLLSLSPLTRVMPNLTSDEHREMYIDFYYRMKEKGIKQRTPAFEEAMRQDPYLNSLRAAYGYAVTCNKSQGGEWKKVYLHMETKIQGMGKPRIYRWWYTAITRSQQELHLADDIFISNYYQPNTTLKY